MVFTTEGFFEVAIENWPEWDYLWKLYYGNFSAKVIDLFCYRDCTKK